MTQPNSDTRPDEGGWLLCRNCRWLSRAFDGIEAEGLCTRPIHGSDSPVSGARKHLKVNAASERRDGKTIFTRRERCGRDAQFFIHKPQAASFGIMGGGEK